MTTKPHGGDRDVRPPHEPRVLRLAIYHFEGCPYCDRVREAAARLGLELEWRDTERVPAHARALRRARGRGTVPVLRVEREGVRDVWLPESADIIEVLGRHARGEALGLPAPDPRAPRRSRVLVALSLILALPLFVVGALGLSPRLLQPLVRLSYPAVRGVDAATLAAELSRPETTPILLDAREEDEVAVSTLAGARRIDPDATDLSSVPRDRAIVVFCSVGWRSAALSDRLMREGASDVRNLEGGIFGWANAGRPIVRDGRIVREVHPFERGWALFLDDALEAYSP